MRNLIASWRYSGMPGFNIDPPGPPLRNASRNIRRARIASADEVDLPTTEIDLGSVRCPVSGGPPARRPAGPPARLPPRPAGPPDRLSAEPETERELRAPRGHPRGLCENEAFLGVTTASFALSTPLEPKLIRLVPHPHE
eukprot:scaffold6508_cov103-Isochrysis_galbana.AAC.4